MNTTHMHLRTHTKPESIGQAGRWQSPYHDTMIDHDKHVGQLLDLLDELGIAEDTIVIYSTDNGPHMNTWPDGAMTPFRSEKDTNWEGAFRVPEVVRWPGKIPAGVVSNEIVQHHDWLPTFLAAAGDPDIVDKLKQGHEVGDKTFKVHIDGYNLLPYLTGEVDKSPRKGMIYFSDDGDVLGMRFDNWKIVFMEQRVPGTLALWAEPFTPLRVPKIFNLRTDPFERADITSNTYWDWFIDNAYIDPGYGSADRHRVPRDVQGVPAPPGAGVVHHRPGRRRSCTSSSAARHRPIGDRDDDAIVDAEVWIPGGTFAMGSDDHYPEEAPAHRVTVDGFWIDRHAGHERAVRRVRRRDRVRDRRRASARPAPTSPARRAENLVPGSLVFTGTPGPVDLRHLRSGGRGRPARPGAIRRARAATSPTAVDHPVVHIAVRGRRGLRRVGRAVAADRGRVGARRARRARRRGVHVGRRTPPGGRLMANHWNGDFPWRNSSPTGTPARRRSGRSRRTATGSTTWPATSGSGRPTGTPPQHPADSRQAVLRPAQPDRRRRRRRATTRPSRSSRSRAR